MKFKLDEEDMQEIDALQDKVEDNSKQLDEIVLGIINPYVKDLDKYVLFIKDVLADGENQPTDAELDDFVMNLSTFIYFASGMCEQLGIRDDIAKSVYKEMYHSVRSDIDKGTIADKNSLAELESQKENIISICYSRAYRIVKSKIDSATEVLASCKKVMSRRMQEMELTHIQK